MLLLSFSLHLCLPAFAFVQVAASASLGFWGVVTLISLDWTLSSQRVPRHFVLFQENSGCFSISFAPFQQLQFDCKQTKEPFLHDIFVQTTRAAAAFGRLVKYTNVVLCSGIWYSKQQSKPFVSK